MGPFATQFLVESLLAPFIVASLILLAARGLEGFGLARGSISLVPALAAILAIAVTYGLAFGWPPGPALDARLKILLSAAAGLLVGTVFGLGSRWLTPAVLLAAAIIPLWVGLPALQQGRLDAAWLLLPIAAPLAAGHLIPPDKPSQNDGLLTAITLATGLAVIAAFARALSFAEIALSLAAALTALLMIGRQPPGMPLILLAIATLQALTSALLLFSEASVLAILALMPVFAADRLARLSRRGDLAHPGPFRPLAFRLLPAAAAILIARIDAGSISIY